MMISTSILKSENPNETILKLEEAGTDFIHLDVMDGKFVENKKEYEHLEIKGALDIHFMVRDVKKYVDDYIYLNPDYMTFHIEVGNTQDYIDYIKSQKIKVGIAINPDTDLKKLIPYLNQIDMVLVMSVIPGKGGQKFIDETLDKMNQLLKLKEEYNFLLEVDGGINDKTIEKVRDIDIVVSGSYITDSNNYSEQINKLKNPL